MRILFDIGHPAHVHQFRNIIRGLEKMGHNVKITARDKDLTYQLLDDYGFSYEKLGKTKKGILGKLAGTISVDNKLYKIGKEFKPDVLVGGSGNIYVAHVGWFLGARSIIFEDSEPEQKIRIFYEPFVTNICVPEGFKGKINDKYIKFKGYKELAYLHPNNFTPDENVLSEAGLRKGEAFVLMRFVGWAAGHDTMNKGIDGDFKHRFVQEMEKHARVLISSEKPLPEDLKKYQILIPPTRIHSLLAFSKMFITDGATMATEAALLGIPTVRTSSLVGTMSNFEELETKYGLMFCYKEPEKALAKAIELIQSPDLHDSWKAKRDKLVSEKTDVAKFMIDTIIGGN